MRPFRRTFFIIPVFAFLFLPPCFCEAQDSTPVPAPSKGNKLAILSTISHNTLLIKTIRSDYVQTRYTAMLKEPIISKGSFFYEKPDRLRWEISKPGPAGFVVNGEKTRRWIGNPDRSEPFELSREPAIRSTVEQVFAWARADIAWIEKRYRITVTGDGNTTLALDPLSPQEKKYIRSIVLRFSDDLSRLRSVRINERGGDSTVIAFENTDLNATLPRDIF
jgi:outer membrane lipoprotein-sorting protein